MSNTNDLRVIKTKKALYNALLELMKEKTFEEIKVSDVCNVALINRSTFYAHYEDKYELLTDCINDLKNDLTLKLKDNKNYDNTKEYYLEMIRLFLNHIEERKEDYMAIVINNRNSILSDIVYDVIERDIVLHLDNDDNFDTLGVPKNIISKFYLGAVVNIGITWIQNINRYTKEEMLDYLRILIPDNFSK